MPRRTQFNFETARITYEPGEEALVAELCESVAYIGSVLERPGRRLLLKHIARHDWLNGGGSQTVETVDDMQRYLDQQQGTVGGQKNNASRNLVILARLGLLQVEHEEQFRYYGLNQRGIDAAATILTDFLGVSRSRYDELPQMSPGEAMRVEPIVTDIYHQLSNTWQALVIHKLLVEDGLDAQGIYKRIRNTFDGSTPQQAKACVGSMLSQRVIVSANPGTPNVPLHLQHDQASFDVSLAYFKYLTTS